MEDGVIDSIVCSLKSGKEADLFVVEREPYHYVAKVYKERRFRSFKNDAGYREGRKVRNTRTQRALAKNTRFGRKLAEQGWHNAEVNALRVLEAAGARVPRILAQHERVLIMEMICDERGQLAPQLAQVPLSREGARAMYDRILEQVVLMLENDLIHGDLSPYNVLVRDGEPVIIDLPQAVSAAHNQQASKLLQRDVHAIARHLGLIDPEIKRLGKLSWQLWEEYERGTLTADFRPDPEREKTAEVGDLEDLVGFVKASKEEGELQARAAKGDKDAQALLRAADRREAKRMRRIEREKAMAEEEAREKTRREQKKAAKKAEAKGGGKKKKRSRRRRGKKSGEAKAKPAKAKTESAEPKAGEKKKKRRRRRRRRGGGKASTDGGQPASSTP